MSASMHVSAFRHMDGNFKRMLEIKNFCDAQQVSYPKEVTDYFGDHISPVTGDTTLYEEFAEIELDDKLRKWDDTAYRSGFEIDVTDIPREAKILRFYVSY